MRTLTYFTFIFFSGVSIFYINLICFFPIIGKKQTFYRKERKCSHLFINLLKVLPLFLTFQYVLQPFAVRLIEG